MEHLDAIRGLFEAYLADTVSLMKNRKLFDGILGLGHSPDRDPCHMKFSGDYQAAVTDAVLANIAPDETAAILRYALGAAKENEENELAYWMLLAIHGMTTPLVALASPADAAELSAWYLKTYPKRLWLPVQKQVATALKTRAGK